MKQMQVQFISTVLLAVKFSYEAYKVLWASLDMLKQIQVQLISTVLLIVRFSSVAYKVLGSLCRGAYQLSCWLFHQCC